MQHDIPNSSLDVLSDLYRDRSESALRSAKQIEILESGLRGIVAIVQRLKMEDLFLLCEEGLDQIDPLELSESDLAMSRGLAALKERGVVLSSPALLDEISI